MRNKKEVNILAELFGKITFKEDTTKTILKTREELFHTQKQSRK